jgi:hypothetical protein
MFNLGFWHDVDSFFVINPSRSIAFFAARLVSLTMLVNAQKISPPEAFEAHPSRFPFDFWFKRLVSQVFHFFPSLILVSDFHPL